MTSFNFLAATIQMRLVPFLQSPFVQMPHFLFFSSIHVMRQMVIQLLLNFLLAYFNCSEPYWGLANCASPLFWV